MTASIRLQTEGRRCYFTGNTYPYRADIRTFGAHWDAERKAWWTGKRAEAEALIRKLMGITQTPGNGEPPRDGLDSVVAGRVEYLGNMYYLAGRVNTYNGKVYAVRSQNGLRVLLYYPDGSRQIWVSHGWAHVTRVYDRQQTIRELREYAPARGADAEQRTPEQIEADRAAEVTRIREIAEKVGVVLVEPMERRSFDPRGQGGVAIGGIVGSRKSGTWLLVITVGTPYYVSPRDCQDAEDRGMFNLRPGWRTPYEAVQIEEPPVQRAARE